MFASYQTPCPTWPSKRRLLHAVELTTSLNVDNCYSYSNVTTELDSFMWEFCISDNVNLANPAFANLDSDCLPTNSKDGLPSTGSGKISITWTVPNYIFGFYYRRNYFDSHYGMLTSLVLLSLKCCLSTFAVCRHLGYVSRFSLVLPRQIEYAINLLIRTSWAKL